jgi:hypothetical protein
MSRRAMIQPSRTATRSRDQARITPPPCARCARGTRRRASGAAKAVSDARAAEQATAVSDDDWWNARAPLFDELTVGVWDDRYPVSARLAAEQAFDQVDRPDDSLPSTVRDAYDTFEFGLQRLLDGFAAHIETTARASRSRTRRP